MPKTARADEIEVANKKAKTEAFDYVRPADWPQVGEDVDLTTQDLPHASANTEWWYINSHCKDDEGNDYSLFVAFFRAYKGVDKNGEPVHLHALSAAVVDVKNKSYHPIAYVDPETPKVLKYQLSNRMYELDPRLNRAFLEVVEKGNVPLPDVMLPGPAVVATDCLNLQYKENNFFTKNADGTYHIRVELKEKGTGFDVVLQPRKKVVVQGNDGVVQVGIKQETMFYYFIPRNDVTGNVTVNGKVINVKGSGWYDHEFGGGIQDSIYTEREGKAVIKDDSFAWNWFSIQLEKDIEITCTNLIDTKTNQVTDNFAVIIDADENRIEYKDMTVTPSKNWISLKTTAQYPLCWDIDVPTAELKIRLEAEFPEQEILTLIAKPAFWEGRLRVTGTYRGVPVTGLGFVERHGFDDIGSLDYFFKKMSYLVRDEIDKVLPYNPDWEQSRDLLADKHNDHYMDGVNLDVFKKTIIDPLRDVVDRGGKSWRSYACLLCIDCVGGDSYEYQHWLSMPELMHVGSLIIDDIQDKSATRRGEPCCHIKFGEPLAINAGTAAYFLAMDILQRKTPNLTPDLRIKLYELYFLTLRAGHCGQAFDINGLEYLMDDAVLKGETEKLLRGVVCTHRLKSAVPAGNLARMGSLIAHGTDEQVQAMGMYYESIGVAFQIIDDVLNLKGFEGDTKTRGEDLHEGKVTYPVARAMKDLSPEKRTEVWNKLKTKPDYDVVAEIIADLESVNAIDASVEDAKNMVEEAWKEVDKYIPDSFFKLMLRAFGYYVLDRHY